MKCKIAFIIFFLFIQQATAGEREVISKFFRHYNKNISDDVTEYVIQAGEHFKVDPLLIASIIVRESGARPNVISKGGDYGLMQVRWKVHRNMVNSPKELLDPKINIFIGTEIFARYYVQKKTLRGALIRYNGGSKTMANRVLATFNYLRNELSEK